MLFLAFSAAIAAQNIYISDIYISGNKLTRDKIILRELPFKRGMTLSQQELEDQIEKAKQNLLNISLFNYVTITYQPAGSNFITNPDSTSTLKNLPKETSSLQTKDSVSVSAAPSDGATSYTIMISVEERWYLWPLFDVKLEDRNLSSWVKKMDTKRITYDFGAKMDNLWGLGHKVTVQGSIGYEKGISAYYSNLALNKSRTSYLNFYGYALFYKNIDYKTEGDKQQRLKSDHLMQKSEGLKATYIYRPGIRTRHSLSLEYGFSYIRDSVLIANPQYWGVDSRYNRKFILTYSYSLDQRNYIFYPTTGYYIGTSATLTESNNFDFVHWNVSADLQYYKQISDRWFWGSTLKLSTSMMSNASYINDQAIGYENVSLTGYDLYVIDGQHYFTHNNTIRYCILPTKIVQLHILKGWKKINKPHFTIYGTVKFDTGYVWQDHHRENNSLSNTFLFGTGVGIDILTYYDIVVNVGYAINRKGTGGFTFGFKAPIY
jgi:outer membrane protein assembly factor BamA